MSHNSRESKERFLLFLFAGFSYIFYSEVDGVRTDMAVFAGLDFIRWATEEVKYDITENDSYIDRYRVCDNAIHALQFKLVTLSS